MSVKFEEDETLDNESSGKYPHCGDSSRVVCHHDDIDDGMDCDTAKLDDDVCQTDDYLKSGDLDGCDSCADESSDVSSNFTISPSTLKIQCNQCNISIYAIDITHHLAVNHPKEDATLKCNDCDKGFRFKSGLSLHRINHHGAVFPSAAVPKKRSRVLLSCVVCGKKFKHVSPLTVHIQESHLESYHECKICDEPFINEEMYLSHNETHASLKRNQCYVCKKVFKSQLSLKEHVIKHKLNFKYRCPKCAKVYLKSCQLSIHSICHIPNKVLKCRVCGKTLLIKSERLTHEGTHFMHKPTNMCKVCKEQFTDRQRLREHVETIHLKVEGSLPLLKSEKSVWKEGSFQHEIECNVCKGVFDRKYYRKVHRTVEQGTFRCIVCPKHFCNENDVLKHLSEHDEPKHNDCCVCGQKLSNLSMIMDHVSKHGVQRNKSYSNSTDTSDDVAAAKCPTCGKSFHLVSSLESHMRIHNKVVENLKCHICQSVFAEVVGVRQHLKRDHPHEYTLIINEPDRRKRNRCDICLQRFKSYFAVRQHRVLHTGVKPFACGVCDKRFVIRSELKFHRLLHLENKPYVCEYCQKSFNKANYLKEHIMIHEGIKPYLCDLCGKAFVNRQKLHLHTFVHTRETPFNCKVCGKGFRATITRQKHTCPGPPMAPELTLPDIEQTHVTEVTSPEVMLDLANASNSQCPQSFNESIVQEQLQQFFDMT